MLSHSLIEHNDCPVRFLITDCPSQEHMDDYLKELQSYNVTLLIRLCDPSAYDPSPITHLGIPVVDAYFEDGIDTMMTHVRRRKSTSRSHCGPVQIQNSRAIDTDKQTYHCCALCLWNWKSTCSCRGWTCLSNSTHSRRCD
jgi:hypothetical protein